MVVVETTRLVVVLDTRRIKITRVNLLIRYYVYDFPVSVNLRHNSAMEDNHFNFG